MEDRFLTPEQVCELVPSLTTGLLKQMRYRGDGPPFIKPSPRTVIYSETSVRRWLSERERSSTLQAV